MIEVNDANVRFVVIDGPSGVLAEAVDMDVPKHFDITEVEVYETSGMHTQRMSQSIHYVFVEREKKIRIINKIYDGSSKIMLLVRVAEAQTVQYSPNDDFPAKTHELALDRIVRMIQELSRRVRNSLNMDPVMALDPEKNKGSMSVAQRANKSVGFDAEGNLTLFSATGHLVFQGTHDASTGLPPDLSGASVGSYWVINGVGAFGGIAWSVGDIAIWNGSTFHRIQGGFEFNIDMELLQPQFTVFAWRRSVSPPSPPTGGTFQDPAPDPAGGWFLTQPSGTDPLWFSRRTYFWHNQNSPWSTPVRSTGFDGASPRVYSIVPTSSVIILDEGVFSPPTINATAYVTIGNTRTVVQSSEAYLVSEAYVDGVWEEITLPHTFVGGEERVRFMLRNTSTNALLLEITVPIVDTAQQGPPGSEGPTGSSVLMAFGRFLNPPDKPLSTLAPPAPNDPNDPGPWWSLVAEQAPGNPLYPLYVTVGQREAGSTLWDWSVPFRFTPIDGQPGLSSLILTIYKRSTDDLSLPQNRPVGGTFNFDTKQLVNGPAGWTAFLPEDNGQPLWSSIALAASPTVSGISNELVWSIPTKVIGTAVVGMNVFVYKRSTLPNLQETPSGGSYNFNTGVLTPPAGWEVMSPSGWETMINPDPALGFTYVSGALAARTQNIAVDSHLIWTESRKLTAEMLLPDGSLNGALLIDNSITTGKIAAHAIVSGHIAADTIKAVHIDADAVTARALAADSVTADKISVDNLSSIESDTGTLTVDSMGHIVSSNYIPQRLGFKLFGNGNLDINQLTIRRGILQADDILLHDPTNFAYNPLFSEPPPPGSNQNKDVPGWIMGDWEGAMFAPNTPGWVYEPMLFQAGSGFPFPGISVNAVDYMFDDDPESVRVLLYNRLRVPVIPGDRLLARARVIGHKIDVGINYYNQNPSGSNSYIKTDWGSKVTSDPVTEEWTVSEVASVVPIGARYAQLIIRKTGRYRSAAVSQVYFGRAVGLFGQIGLDTIPMPAFIQGSQSFSGSSFLIATPVIPAGLILRYTVDGTEVTSQSPLWPAGGVVIMATTTFRARFFNQSGFAGPEFQATYIARDSVKVRLPNPIIVYENLSTVIRINQITISKTSGGNNPPGFSSFRYRVDEGSWVSGGVNVGTWNLSLLLLVGQTIEVEALTNDANNYVTSTAVLIADPSLGGSGNWILP